MWWLRPVVTCKLGKPQVLIHKLSHYGITGRVNAWVKSFLGDRQQAVVIDRHLSSYVPVESGVPQHPVLFLLYISDLPQQTRLQLQTVC